MRNVLSLFDGISCGRLALDRAGIKYKNYFASEIDKYAIAVAKYNYPDTIFVGDIRNLKGHFLKEIDLMIGGSPCQNLSLAGKRQGMSTKEKIEIISLEQYLELKEQGVKFEGQSYLFWEFVRLLKEIKPKWFLLENVRMVKKWRDIISKTLEVEPIEINSALVSAQNRKRLYWTNIPVKGLPQDKKILLKDILEKRIDKKYYLNIKPEEYNLIKWYLTSFFGGSLLNRDKSLCIDASYYKGGNLRLYFKKHRRQLVFEFYENKIKVRKLTPVECERLQTLPDNYTQYGLFEDGKIKKISDTQRYKMIGNAWTVDIISWFLSFLREN